MKASTAPSMISASKRLSSPACSRERDQSGLTSAATMGWMRRLRVAIGVSLFAVGFRATAADLPRTQLDFFENKIRPVFAEHCYKCHSSAEGKVKGGLELDWKGGWEK